MPKLQQRVRRPSAFLPKVRHQTAGSKPRENTGANYPCLNIYKTLVKVIGIIVIVISVILGLISAGAATKYLRGGFAPLLYMLTLIIYTVGGCVAAFGLFMLSEVIDLFVTMGKNINAIANDVSELKNRNKS